jgi:hypothetical protein
MIRDPETGKRVSRPNEVSEHREADAPHLALISQETFDQAIAIVEGRAKKAQGGQYTRRPKRLLSGLLRCGHCGGGMSVHDHSGGSIRIRCSRSTESGVCENHRRYRLDKIEKAVIRGLKAQLDKPDLLAALVRAIADERRAESAKNTRDRSGLERKLNELNGQLERLMQAMTRGVLPIGAVEAQYAPIEAERNKIAAKLAAVEPSSVVQLHPKAADQYRLTVESLAKHLDGLDERHDAETIATFRELVDSVVVIDTADGGYDAHVIGHLEALIGKDAAVLGGRVVAEDRLTRSPQIFTTFSFGRFAA